MNAVPSGRSAPSGLRRNVSLLVLLQGANFVAPLVTLPYLARVLGPAQFGALAFAQAITQYFVVLGEYGFNLSATRDIARRRDDRDYVSRTFFSVMAAKALLVSVGFAALLLLVAVVPRLREIGLVLVVLYGTVVGSMMLPVWLFLGLEQMTVITAASVGAKAIMIPATFLVVTRASDIVPAAAAYAGSFLLAGGFGLWVVARSRLVRWVRPTWRDVVSRLRSGWHVFVSSAAISVYTGTNTVIAGVLGGDAAAGVFAAGEKVVRAVASLNHPVSQAVYPRINAELVRSRRAGIDLMTRVGWLQGGVMLLASMALAVGSRPLAALAFGGRYAGAAQVIAILSPIPIAIGMGCIFGVQALLPLGFQRTFSRVVLAGGALNLAIVVPLTWLWLERGTAFAASLTEIAVGGAMAFLAIRAIRSGAQSDERS
jgi:O-antigen/teichoic acid export membrane protein